MESTTTSGHKSRSRKKFAGHSCLSGQRQRQSNRRDTAETEGNLENCRNKNNGQTLCHCTLMNARNAYGNIDREFVHDFYSATRNPVVLDEHYHFIGPRWSQLLGKLLVFSFFSPFPFRPAPRFHMHIHLHIRHTPRSHRARFVFMFIVRC